MSEDLETVLLVKPQAFVYKPPPPTSTRGYRAKEWNLSQPLWTGRMVIKSKGRDCVIHLENDDGSDFATCPIYADKKGPESVEKVVDSSRYFVLRIEDGSGRSAFIGMGFNERNDAFDFTAAIQDHQKYFEQQKEVERAAKERKSQPAKDYSLGEGQKITLSINTQKTGAKSSRRRRYDEDDEDDDDSFGFLPPPPDFGAPASAPTPVAAAPAAAPAPSASADLFAGFDAPTPQPQQQQQPFGQQAFGQGQTSPFGQGQTSPFGQGQTSPFGQQPFAAQGGQPPFAQPQQQPAFAQQQPFGQPQQQPFGQPQQQQPAFAQQQPFGQGGQPQFGQQPAFASGGPQAYPGVAGQRQQTPGASDWPF